MRYFSVDHRSNLKKITKAFAKNYVYVKDISKTLKRIGKIQFVSEYSPMKKVKLSKCE